MSLTFHCESCDAIFPLGCRLSGGARVKCPMCSAVTTIPAEPVVKPRPARPTAPGTAPKPSADHPPAHGLACPGCSVRLKVPASFPVGATVKCPKCGKLVKTPGADAAATVGVSPPDTVPLPPVPALKPQPLKPEPPKPEPPKAAPSPEFSIDAIAHARKLPTAPARLPDRPSPAGRTGQARKAMLAVGVVVVIGLAVGVVKMVRPEPTPKLIAVGPEPIAESDWKPFSPPNGHCQVLLPGEPTPVPSEPPPEGVEAPESKHFRVDRPDRDAWFSLYLVHLPPYVLDQQTFDEFYFNLRDEVIDRSAGRLRLETPLSWKGHFGREFQVETPRGQTIVQRMYFVEHPNYIRLYVLQATVGGKHGPATAAKYLDSLKLPPRMGVAVADERPVATARRK